MDVSLNFLVGYSTPVPQNMLVSWYNVRKWKVMVIFNSSSCVVVSSRGVIIPSLHALRTLISFISCKTVSNQYLRVPRLSFSPFCFKCAEWLLGFSLKSCKEDCLSVTSELGGDWYMNCQCKKVLFGKLSHWKKVTHILVATISGCWSLGLKMTKKIVTSKDQSCIIIKQCLSVMSFSNNVIASQLHHIP